MKAIVFVDYWNLQLTLQQQDAIQLGVPQGSHRFNINWYQLGLTLTNLASDVAQNFGINLVYQETRIYTSNDPNDNGRFKNWVTNQLNRQPSIRAYCLERKIKRNVGCPSCGHQIHQCPSCSVAFNATQEKGVDTLLVTHLLSLGLDNTYDVAILVSQDSDMKPAVSHLSDKGIKVIHAGIKHFGADLSNACWAKFDIFQNREQLKRPA